MSNLNRRHYNLNNLSTKEGKVKNTAQANDQMWKDQKPSCCVKDKNKELPEER